MISYVWNLTHTYPSGPIYHSSAWHKTTMAEWGEAGGSLTHVSDLEPSDLVLITLIPPCRLGAAFPQQAGHFKIFQIHQRCSRTKNHPTIYQPIFPDNLQNLNCSQTTCFPKSTTIPCWIRFRYLHLEDHSVDYRINQWFFSPQLRSPVSIRGVIQPRNLKVWNVAIEHRPL